MLDQPRYHFHELYFEGRWQAGTAAPLAVLDPWSGERIAQIAAATAHEVDRAFQAASHAQHAWAALLPGEKTDVFRRCAAIMEVRQTEIVDWLVRESGSTQQQGADRVVGRAQLDARGRDAAVARRRGGSSTATTRQGEPDLSPAGRRGRR